MALTRRRFLAISAAASVAGPARAAPTKWRGYAMGADVAVTLPLSPSQAEPLFQRIEAKLRKLEGVFSLFDPDSQLSRLNRDSVIENPDAELLSVLTLCNTLHDATQGRFDPTVQPLWQAAARQVAQGNARAAIGWERVRFDTGKIELAPEQALTLNGIAQGYATDVITTLLGDAGLDKVLVNIGEFSGRGGPWQMGISDPVHGLVAQRALNNGALATSSPFAMTLPKGQSHILDPINSLATPRWSTVCVEAQNAAIADGASTALCLASLEHAQEIVARLPEVRRVTFVRHNGTLQEILA